MALETVQVALVPLEYYAFQCALFLRTMMRLYFMVRGNPE